MLATPSLGANAEQQGLHTRPRWSTTCNASADAILARVLAVQVGNSGSMPAGALAGSLTALC